MKPEPNSIVEHPEFHGDVVKFANGDKQTAFALGDILESFNRFLQHVFELRFVDFTRQVGKSLLHAIIRPPVGLWFACSKHPTMEAPKVILLQLSLANADASFDDGALQSATERLRELDTDAAT